MKGLLRILSMFVAQASDRSVPSFIFFIWISCTGPYISHDGMALLVEDHVRVSLFIIWINITLNKGTLLTCVGGFISLTAFFLREFFVGKSSTFLWDGTKECWYKRFRQNQTHIVGRVWELYMCVWGLWLAIFSVVVLPRKWKARRAHLSLFRHVSRGMVRCIVPVCLLACLCATVSRPFFKCWWALHIYIHAFAMFTRACYIVFVDCSLCVRGFLIVSLPRLEKFFKLGT